MSSKFVGYAAIGRWVAERRKDMGWSQGELAKRAGLARSTISNLEAGNQRIGVHILAEIGLLFGYRMNLEKRR